MFNLAPDNYPATASPVEVGAVARIRRAMLAFALLIAFGGGVAVDRLLWQGGSDAGASSSLTDLPEFQTMQQTWDAIQDNYVDTDALDSKALIYGASRGMVDALGDTGHSTFLDPDEADAFQRATEGEFVGIGIQIDYSTGRPVIVAAIDGSPADKAGIRARDVITAINGQSTDGMTDTQASQLLRGDAGTNVELTIERPADGSSFTLNLTRAKIKIEPVSWALLPDNVGLIRISEFSVGATDGVKDALRALKEEGVEKIILDLRDNPGGLVFEAIGVASQFMEEGTPIYQFQERDEKPRPVRTTGRGLGTDLPIVVLVNEGSASAAEIVASGLRDNGRATLVGERTFGTGTVLSAFPLDDGSIVVLGIALWLTPDGQEIWHKGVEPDLEVDLAPDADALRPNEIGDLVGDDIESTRDAQFKAAFDQITDLDAAADS